MPARVRRCREFRLSALISAGTFSKKKRRSGDSAPAAAQSFWRGDASRYFFLAFFAFLGAAALAFLAFFAILVLQRGRGVDRLVCAD